jgi:hypothetical protein
VREDGKTVGGEERQEKVYNREEWKKLLRMGRNFRILRTPKERMNELFYLSDFMRGASINCSFVYNVHAIRTFAIKLTSL